MEDMLVEDILVRKCNGFFLELKCLQLLIGWVIYENEFRFFDQECLMIDFYQIFRKP